MKRKLLCSMSTRCHICYIKMIFILNLPTRSRLPQETNKVDDHSIFLPEKVSSGNYFTNIKKKTIHLLRLISETIKHI